MLDRYGYDPKNRGKPRRKKLKKAIQDSNFDLVFEALKELKSEMDGYKAERIRHDMKFLRDRQDRYYTRKERYDVDAQAPLS